MNFVFSVFIVTIYHTKILSIYTKPSSFQEHWTQLDTAAAVRWMEGKLIFFTCNAAEHEHKMAYRRPLWPIYINKAASPGSSGLLSHLSKWPHTTLRWKNTNTLYRRWTWKHPDNIFALSCYLTKNCPAVKKTWKYSVEIPRVGASSE